MNLFGKRGGILGGPLDNPLGGGLFEKRPSIIEKVEMIFTDVETEGKKQGYDRAANEYGKVYRAIETEFLETKKLIELNKNSCDNQVEGLINKLEALEKEKSRLEQQVNSKIHDVSSKFDIPIGDVKKSLACGTLLVGGPLASVDILDLIYRHKEKKLKQAEQRGYAEARELYENKIERLKAELRRLKEDANKDIQNLIMMIDEVLEAIINEQMKIAELRVLL